MTCLKEGCVALPMDSRTDFLLTCAVTEEGTNSEVATSCVASYVFHFIHETNFLLFKIHLGAKSNPLGASGFILVKFCTKVQYSTGSSLILGYLHIVDLLCNLLSMH